MIHRPKAVLGYLPLLFIALLAPAVPSAYALDPFQESAGEVVMEAENYDTKVSRSSHDWTASTAKSGYSGTSAMRATPETATEITTGYATTSPELIYNIAISTPGTYYVWMRGFKPDGGADSVHVGIDGTAPSSGSNMDQFVYNQWTWVHDTRTVQISTAGLHTFHIWMREDGFYADKIVLRQGSAGTAPTGTGPTESPRVPVGGGDITPPTGSVSIQGGAAATNTTAVTLTLSATDAGGVTEMKFSNDNVTFSTPIAYAVSASWTLATGDGTKTVYAKFKDTAGNWSSAFNDTIVLDTVQPQITITTPLDETVITP